MQCTQGDHELKTRYVLSVLGVKLEYFVRHVHRPSINTVTWTLDYDRLSDFGASLPPSFEDVLGGSQPPNWLLGSLTADLRTYSLSHT